MTTGEIIEFSAEARSAHASDEAIIDAGLATFVEVGLALMRIRDRRTYLLTHGTFTLYCRDRWRFNAPYAYNLMAGAEVISVLDGAGVDVKPANARVAYELRSLIDEPDKLVSTWRQALVEHGDKPLAREVARTLRGDDARALPERAGPSEPEPDDELTDEQRDFAHGIENATAQLEAAKSAQRLALRDVDPKLARRWSRDVKRLRTIAQDLQRAVDRKT